MKIARNILGVLLVILVVLLLLDFWPLRRFAGRSDQQATAPEALRSPRVTVVALLREKVPFFAMAVAVSAMTWLIQVHVGAVGTLTQLSLDFRVANALLSYVTYIRQMLWPTGLAVFYPYPPTLPAWWLVAAAAVVLIAVSIAVVVLSSARMAASNAAR